MSTNKTLNYSKSGNGSGEKTHKNARHGPATPLPDPATPLPRPLAFLRPTIPLPCPDIIFLSGLQAFINETRKIHYFGIG